MDQPHFDNRNSQTSDRLSGGVLIIRSQINSQFDCANKIVSSIHSVRLYAHYNLFEFRQNQQKYDKRKLMNQTNAYIKCDCLENIVLLPVVYIRHCNLIRFGFPFRFIHFGAGFLVAFLSNFFPFAMPLDYNVSGIMVIQLSEFRNSFSKRATDRILTCCLLSCRHHFGVGFVNKFFLHFLGCVF